MIDSSLPASRRAVSRTITRLASGVGVIIPVYGLIRLLVGLLHFVLPARILDTVPELVSDVHNAHAIVSGVALFFLGLGLLKRHRFSYWACIAVLGLSVSWALAVGVTPWFWGSATLALILLAPLRRAFDRPTPLLPTPSQVVGLIAVSLALAYGIIGSYLLRDHFTNLTSWSDAVYFAVTTLTTLGYGDIVPVAGRSAAKLFSVSLVVVGISAFLTAVSLVIVPFLESQTREVMQAMDRFRKRTQRGHVLVCFHTQVGQSVVNELRRAQWDFLVIEPNEAAAAALQADGTRVLQGDPTDESILRKANIEEARAVLACSDRDADNALITLIAQDLRQSGINPGLRIVARVEQEKGIRKLQAAGADYVVSPSALGGRMMIEQAMAPSDPDLSTP